jgi:hypothetical protein
MDKPADPAAPFSKVYQSFFDDLTKEGIKPSTIHRYRYNIVRFEKWLVANGHPAILASLERTILFAYRHHLETLPQQPRGSIRRRHGGQMSRHTVHSYLRSIKCLASWLKGAGHISAGVAEIIGQRPMLDGVAHIRTPRSRSCVDGGDRDRSICGHGAARRI